MATPKTNTPHPDTKRDFETGTVNPGPGMAPPHRADDRTPGAAKPEKEARQQGQQGQQNQPGQRADEKEAQKDQSCGSCGCG